MKFNLCILFLFLFSITPLNYVHAKKKSRSQSQGLKSEIKHKSSLENKINKILSGKEFRFTSTAVVIKSLKDGKILFQKNPKRSLIPASVTKMILTSAFLYKLYPNFQYRIHVLKKGDDIYLKPFGDPLIDHAQLWSLVQHLKFYDIKSINGDLLMDLSAFDIVESIDNEFHSDLRYNSALSPFSIGFNAVFFNVRPDVTGQPAKVNILPDLDYFEISNNTISSKDQSAHQLSSRFIQKDTRQHILLTGTVSKPRVFYLKITDPAKYMKQLLYDYFKRSTLPIKGKIFTASAPEDATLLFEFPGRIIPEALRLMNSYSNNFMAEQLFLTLGGEVYGYPSSREKGVRAISTFLKKDIGINPNRFRFENGSGLTRANQITAADLVKFLEWNSQNHFFPEFLSMLSDASENSTLKNRVKDKPYLHNLRAKTGTLDDVSAITGYLNIKGNWIAISIIVNQAKKEFLSQIRRSQDQILHTVYQSQLHQPKIK